MSKPYFPSSTPECFTFSAIAHHHKQITTSEYLDNLLAHLQGVRHPEDVSPTKTGLNAVTDPLSMLIQDACLFEPTFVVVNDIIGIKNLLIDCWTGLLNNVKQEAPPVLKIMEVHEISKYMYEIILCIGCIRGDAALFSYCLSLNEYLAEMVGSSLVPLQRTIFNNNCPNIEIWRLLLDNGLILDRDSTFTPGINSTSQQNLTYLALQVLQTKGLPQIELLAFLFEHGLVVSDYLMSSAAERANPEVVQYLMAKDGSRPKDDRALLRAVYSNNRPMLEILINAGMSVNYNSGRTQSKDPFDGRPSDTPLHAAAERAYMNMVKLLLEKGAWKTAEDSHGRTAVERAKAYGHADIARLIQNWES